MSNQCSRMTISLRSIKMMKLELLISDHTDKALELVTDFSCILNIEDLCIINRIVGFLTLVFKYGITPNQ